MTRKTQLQQLRDYNKKIGYTVYDFQKTDENLLIQNNFTGEPIKTFKIDVTTRTVKAWIKTEADKEMCKLADTLSSASRY